MNALDQAFIKAFAKDPSVGAGQQSAASTPAHSHTQDPPQNPRVASESWALHGVQVPGRRLRVDRPQSMDAGVLSGHLIMPVVEQVQSYAPEDLARSGPAQVVVEDRLQALAEAIRRRVEASRSAEAAARASARSDPSGEPARDPVAEAVQPLVSLAAAELYRPDLQHRQLACLQCGADTPVHADTIIADAQHPDTHPARLDADPCAGRPEQAAARTGRPIAAAAEALAEDLAEHMVAASGIEQVELPVGPACPSAGHGLSRAEEAALLGRAVAPRSLEPFAAAWEVDAFHWPTLCTQLDVASGHRLSASGDELYMAVQDGLKVVAITSAQRREGRTTIALSLARSAAAAGCRVALVDADGANPELAHCLGLDAPCDWRETQRDRQPLREAAVASLNDRVTLFPLTGSDDDLTGRLDDPALTCVLKELQQAFDLVVVDARPVLECPVSGATAPGAGMVDMVLVVRNVQGTTPEVCLSAVGPVRAMGVRAVGIVENFVPAEEAAAF